MSEKNGIDSTTELDREVIRCQVCGLVQYRTRTGNCRRCLRLMPPKVAFVIPSPSPQDLPGDDRQLFENWPNRETVENIGQRIRQLRESRAMTQSQLQARSRVSRSYLSRIESGQMTPSLGTVSYTHLDVYKRQSSYRTRRGPGLAATKRTSRTRFPPQLSLIFCRKASCICSSWLRQSFPVVEISRIPSAQRIGLVCAATFAPTMLGHAASSHARVARGRFICRTVFPKMLLAFSMRRRF